MWWVVDHVTMFIYMVCHVRKEYVVPFNAEKPRYHVHNHVVPCDTEKQIEGMETTHTGAAQWQNILRDRKISWDDSFLQM